jgi:hypothetical protein
MIWSSYHDDVEIDEEEDDSFETFPFDDVDIGEVDEDDTI